MNAPAELSCTEEVPGVGICQNDLHFVATTVAGGFGNSSVESPLDVVKAAVNQASIELKLLADQALEQDSPEWYWLLGIVDRLEAAAESSELLFKMAQLPNLKKARRVSEVQP